MKLTRLNYNCAGETLVDGSTQYRTQADIAVAGELPDAALFVYTVGDVDVPGTDSFVRVATPLDLTNIPRTRQAALTAKSPEYRSVTVVLNYPSLEVAVQAKKMLTSRVNALVRAWLSYSVEFYSDSGFQVFPTSDGTLAEGLIVDFTEARNVKTEAEAAVTAAESAVEIAANNVSWISQLVDTYQYVSDFCTVESSVTTRGFYQLLLKYHAAVDADGTTPETEALWGSGPGTVLGDFTTFMVYIQTMLQDWRNQLTASRTAYNDAAATKATAEQNLRAAEKAEAEALAAVRNDCPSFDPSTV